MFSESKILNQLAQKFAALPGIGKKSAWRLAFYTLKLSDDEINEFAQTLINAHKNIKRCEICQSLTDNKVCGICASTSRDKSVICVVESTKDVMAFEQSRSFSGLYHVLHGLISPIDGIGPADLTIKSLLERVKSDTVKEVIMATSPTIEGDTTAIYIAKLLKPLSITVSRLALGVPVGSELQYADEMTISKALEFRNIL